MWGTFATLWAFTTAFLSATDIRSWYRSLTAKHREQTKKGPHDEGPSANCSGDSDGDYLSCFTDVLQQGELVRLSARLHLLETLFTAIDFAADELSPPSSVTVRVAVYVPFAA